MARRKSRRNRKQNVRHSDYVSTDKVIGAGEVQAASGIQREVPAHPSLDTVNHQVEGNISENNGGLITNTGMESMITNPNSMKNNVNNVIPANDGDISAERPTSVVELAKTKEMTENNSIDKNAIEMALHNASEIAKLKDEIMALRTGLEMTRGDFDKSSLGCQAAVLAIFGALYGKQLDDIKHGYDLEDINNKIIKNGIDYAIDIKAQKSDPKYRNAVKRYLNANNMHQVAAPAPSGTPSVDREEQAADDAGATTSAGSIATMITTAAAAPAQDVDDAGWDEEVTHRQANVGWEEHNIDVMAEKRRSNIIIKGIPESSMMGDRREVEEILKDMYCRQRINQLKSAGITRLGGKQGSRNRLLMLSFDNEEAANQVYERRYMLDGHPYMGKVYIMRDLPRSERGSRRVSNTLNEAANSGGNRTQGNLGRRNRVATSLGENEAIGSGAILTANRGSTNNTNVERGESRAVNDTREITDVEERDSDAWTNSSTEQLRGTAGDRAGGTTGDAHEPRRHPTEATAGARGNESEQQSAGGERGETGNGGESNNSGNDGLGEKEKGS